MCPAPKFMVTVAYDCYRSRSEKVFCDLYEARRFYTAKFVSGKNPSIKAKVIGNGNSLNGRHEGEESAATD